MRNYEHILHRGAGEDELEWHITGYYENPDDINAIAVIMEIDFCVRIAEQSE